jgi:hypothetical protein
MEHSPGAPGRPDFWHAGVEVPSAVRGARFARPFTVYQWCGFDLPMSVIMGDVGDLEYPSPIPQLGF